MSKWTSVAGTVRIKRSGASGRVHRLLSAFVNQLGTHARAHHRRSDDVPYAYNESQMHSIVFPAFHDVCQLVFREQPLERRPRAEGESGGHGAVDYWLEREGRFFMVEYKHSDFSLGHQKFHTWAQQEWSTGQAQLGTILEHGGPDLLESEIKGTALLLMSVRHYRTSKKGRPRSSDAKACWKSHKALLSQVADHDATAHPVNWSALWMAPADMRHLEYAESFAHIPAVSLLAASAPVVGD